MRAMMSVRCSFLWFLLLAFPAAAQERIDLRVLYVGNAGSERAEAYARFLAASFREARPADRATFEPGSARGFDAVLLDWSYDDTRGQQLSELKSPLGPLDEWDHPTVLLGSAGLLIGGPWETAGSYG